MGIRYIAAAGGIDGHDGPHHSSSQIFLAVGSIDDLVVHQDRCIDPPFAEAKSPHRLPGSGLNGAHGSVGVSLYEEALTPNRRDGRRGLGVQIGWTLAGCRHPQQLTRLLVEGECPMQRGRPGPPAGADEGYDHAVFINHGCLCTAPVSGEKAELFAQGSRPDDLSFSVQTQNPVSGSPARLAHPTRFQGTVVR